ncbi:apical endosomal glycoprotein isoform X2 [Hippocampus comes]|uniref:apical endosomal glycoprotein isoform X1 n=1 Tax=Hippocampus comes TaxID=109280 RepID=UPI00094F3875|nr:PREDICTED: apical endosomal glycoprotein isoform X1 [Hippocampus comes]XP_019735216.1 PREDICTED: apical endosomal glycoprotein isoform X2 [Hippocampus comes]
MWWKGRRIVQIRTSALILAFILHFAASHPCLSPERRCDFVCDCLDCDDEQDCGYSGKGFRCDFEDSGICGWKDQSLNAAYRWERRQRGDTLTGSGPSSDFTTGTASGWFMGVTEVKSQGVKTAVLVSPKMQESSPTCRLRLRYFLWDSGQTGLGSSPLLASVVQQDTETAVVWRPEATSFRGWREATVFLGRIAAPFQIHLYSNRLEGRRGDVAVDQLEFLDCALPLPLPGKECPAEMLACKRGGCVAQRQVCDGTDDCGDWTDEENCEGYRRCDFENDVCDWDLRSLSNLKWVRTSQENISDPLKGPGRDHSNNSVSGHFLYVTVPDGGLRKDWAAFQSPPLEPTTSTHPCKMVMYTHQFGPRSGGLTVLVADKSISAAWKRGGALGDVWVKAEVEIVNNSTFQILIMAAVRELAYGGVAVDNIVLSPECRRSNDSMWLEKFPKSPKDPCTVPEKMCDFESDCEGAEDEAACGDFSYSKGSSGWTDTSIGSQGWVLHQNSTAKEEYLYVAEAPGQQLTEAQTRTPLLGPSGPACTLQFDFALTGNPAHIGELSVRVIDSMLGVQPKLWEFSGKTGTEEAAWQPAQVAIGARKHRFQLAFESRAVKLGPSAKIQVKNVHFTGCHANYFPSSSTALTCNFEDGPCGWHQDNSDNFDWTLVDGMDHTIGFGKSFVVDMWSSSLRGAFGRLLSLPLLPSHTGHCLTFFYKIYGTNIGALNVKLFDKDGYEKLLWTRSGAHGNMWHEAHCPVPLQFTTYQLMFEAVRSGFDGQVAIDDVALVAHPCSVPRLCSFEGQQCGYRSSGQVYWVLRNGHTPTATGPKTDHTLETELGFYMMVQTGGSVLPAGAITTLTSPVRIGKAHTECLNFWYHMGSENPGSLSVYMKPMEGERVKIFTDNQDQGDVWRHANGNISSNLMDWQLQFEVIGRGGKDTHVAIDDIFLSAHPCENQGSKCSFEKGMCTWSNTQNIQRDQLDWELTSHEKEMHYSTPSEDHSLGTEKGHFLFLPSSNRTATNQKAQLLGPHLPPTKGTCLKFWLYKQYSTDSQLKVWTLSKGLLNEQLDVTELEGPWRRFDIDIVSTEEYQIVFEGIKGAVGVLALDDIEYTVGVNCAKKVTDGATTSTKPSNAGGIAASVIVVLLLIGTLIALFIYYLRTQMRVQALTDPSSSSSLEDRGGFGNDNYEADLSEDHVRIRPAQTHPMAAGFNNVSVSSREREAA